MNYRKTHDYDFDHAVSTADEVKIKVPHSGLFGFLMFGFFLLVVLAFILWNTDIVLYQFVGEAVASASPTPGIRDIGILIDPGYVQDIGFVHFYYYVPATFIWLLKANTQVFYLSIAGALTGLGLINVLLFIPCFRSSNRGIVFFSVIFGILTLVLFFYGGSMLISFMGSLQGVSSSSSSATGSLSTSVSSLFHF